MAQSNKLCYRLGKVRCLLIKFEGVRKNYKSTEVLTDISFEVKKGELVVLIGSSGCGKTTTLKLINKLITPSAGRILIEGEDIAEKDTIEHRRNIGYVIQQIGLFPHMTVRENIEIVPKLMKLNIEEYSAKTKALLKMVGLDPEIYLDRYPIQLSGGQQQRIGVARAFAIDPDIILMDEPFSAVDPITRRQLQDELVNLQAKVKKTIVFVTHDMDEALKIGDKICIMQSGEIVQFDTPENILKNPINEFVSKFVGKNRIWNNPEYIRAKDIMITEPVTAYKEVSVIKVIENMRLRKVDRTLVIDESGIFLGHAKGSALSKVENKSAPVETVMKQPKVTATPYDSIVDLLEKVREFGVSAIPVIDDDKRLCGLITTATLVTTLGQQFVNFEGVASDE